ncbi:MAG: 50S ribosomal protein L9 [Gammaproteobacteria bacterium]
MDVILLEKVPNLGELGEKVKVRSGYARNYLLPQGRAVAATAANVAEFEKRRAQLEARQAEVRSVAEAQASALGGLTVTLARKAGEEGRLFGSVGTSDIAEAVSALGIGIEKQQVRLPTGALRQVGEYQVTVHLHSDVDAVVRVEVVAES